MLKWAHYTVPQDSEPLNVKKQLTEIVYSYEEMVSIKHHNHHLHLHSKSLFKLYILNTIINTIQSFPCNVEESSFLIKYNYTLI